MAAEKNICEEIEIAIYSDSELTEEQKNHIENCESCKALLSQVSEMKSQLGTLTVPGIAEGSVADSVMNEVKNQRMAAAVPKFRWTHHLGTAAAIVIVLVAALILKNPSDTDPQKEKPAVDNSKSNIAQKFNDHELNPSYTYTTDDSSIGTNENDEIATTKAASENENAAYEEQTPDQTTNQSANQPPIFLAKSPYSAEESVQDGSMTDNVNSPSQEEYSRFFADEPVESDSFSDSGAVNDVDENREQLQNAGSGGGSAPPAPSASIVENETAKQDTDSNDVYDAEDINEAEQDNSSVSTEENPDTTNQPSSITITGSSIFNGITFLEGEEYFDYNVDLANERLSSLYNNEYLFSKSKLREMGMTNADLLSYAPLITQKNFDSYKGLLDVFE
ncbi:MAG: hypothetical protein E7600_08505 [Ruminococcaceae bacterium]|nr:hypothetical protein [Oscillospiraceae bacterium]